MKTIASKTNETFKKLLSVKKGKEIPYLLIEGVDLLDEAKKCLALEEVIIYSEEFLDAALKYGKEVILLKKELFRELASYSSLPPFLAVAKKELSSLKESGNRVIFLDNVQDPGNCGTILRTALSFSYSALALTKDSVSVYNNKVIQASKGSIFHLPIISADLREYARLGYHIYLTTLGGKDERELAKLEEPFVLVFGNEGRGVREEYMDLGEKLTIAINSIDSLNVAVASGIFMYRFQRR